MPVLPRVKDYKTLYAQFRWQVPARYNIGVDVCDRWAAKEPDRLAILHARPDGRDEHITYGWLRETSNRLANVLKAHGITRGDRVAILLPQSPEVAAIHIAIYKLGGVALPLAVLFGTDALSYRLQNSGAAAMITNARGAERIAEIRNDLPALKVVFSLDGAGNGALDFTEALARASPDLTPVDTSADDSAMMVYTSGTTGQPKG
ncbi:MAG TPA: AMP-binding protein, partial [Pseudolabrys sp.]|nr:AMP-binding protein [Pseudolabrys sp.]